MENCLNCVCRVNFMKHDKINEEFVLGFDRFDCEKRFIKRHESEESMNRTIENHLYFISNVCTLDY